MFIWPIKVMGHIEIWPILAHCSEKVVGPLVKRPYLFLHPCGRYPLIYQSLRLALNYLKRLQNLPYSTFAHAATKEQKAMKLPWYQNLEPLMKLDEIFHLEHVKAHRVIKSKGNADSIEPRWELNRNNNNLTNKLMQLENVRPLPSEKFRVKNVIDKLSNKFAQCWQFEKSVSSKLSFFDSVKQKIARETYLDSSKRIPTSL